MKNSLTLLLALGLASLSFGRVGPVSQYGQLQAGKTSDGLGRIFGSCPTYNSEPVQVKGMSLYWSLLGEATEFWNAEAIATMVSDMNIQVIRAAMATGTENWGGPAKGYVLDPDKQKALVNAVVQGAIDNDIYVIIDWHSHEADQQTESAKAFFGEMAQKWGQYDHVIFEVFNEPKTQTWATVKNYAEQVVQVIRQYSDNLILVGNPSWSATPSSAINNEVNDPQNNIAYTFHYYAMTHSVSNEGKRVTRTLSAGLPVFVSEWGTGTADGKGYPGQSENDSWQSFMDENKLSWANWSASKINEGTAAFQGSSSRYSLSYSSSGNVVKGYLASNPTSYTACGGSEEAIGVALAPSGGMNVSVLNKELYVSGVNSALVSIFDLQGRAIVKNRDIQGSLNLEGINPGSYVFQIRSGSMAKTLRMQVR